MPGPGKDKSACGEKKVQLFLPCQFHNLLRKLICTDGYMYISPVASGTISGQESFMRERVNPLSFKHNGSNLNWANA